jgi:hypothetical protein
MGYTPDWLPLAEALQRVIAMGVREEGAKIDLCRAVADRKIGVRVRIAATGKIFSDGNVGIPPHLNAGDLDWTTSRPLKQWSIGPRIGEHYVWLDGWTNYTLDLIELSTVDLTDVLSSAEAKKQLNPLLVQHRKGGNSLARRLAEELRALYPKGRPPKPNEVIRRELEARPTVGKFAERTLQRALSVAWPKP